MSEANTTPNTSGVDSSPAPTGSAAASLYPDGGGQGGASAAPVAPAGEASVTAPSGADTLSGGEGADTLVGGQGADTVSGADTASSTEAGADGNDTLSGNDAPDALTVESYKDLTLPEGFVVDDALMTTAKTTFAELGIPPDQAPKLLDLYATAAKAANAQAAEAFQAEQTAWVNEIHAMPEFQGEAQATSLQAIGRVLDEYGTPEARAALDANGTGNNPALVKMFFKIAQALSEGPPTGQGRPAPTGADGRPVSLKGKTIGQRLYPDQQ